MITMRYFDNNRKTATVVTQLKLSSW